MAASRLGDSGCKPPHSIEASAAEEPLHAAAWGGSERSVL